MRLFNFVLVLGALVTPAVLATPSRVPTHNACKVLTGEDFGRIMGYKASAVSSSETAAECTYAGPADAGGEFIIMTESASGPQAEAMLHGIGSSPPPGSGMLGGTYKEGSIVFAISIMSTDKGKLEALIAHIRRKLQ